jgi:hypothetical protein
LPYYAGLDLGKQQDPSALSIVSVDGNQEVAVHLERFALGTPYAHVAARTAALIKSPLAFSPELVVDRSGVGDAAIELLAAEGLEPIPVLLHGGEKTTFRNGTWHVPKATLLGTLERALRGGTFKIAAGLALGPALKDELITTRYRMGEGGHLSFSHRTKDAHGDLMVATALAVWCAHRCGAS